MSREELLQIFSPEEGEMIEEHMNEQHWQHLENADPDYAMSRLEKTLSLARMVPFEL